MEPVGLFKRQLAQLGIAPETYLRRARTAAYHSRGRYNPADIFFSTSKLHKLEYHTPEGIVRFGRPGYDDFHIYSLLEERGERLPGTSLGKRYAYLKRSRGILGDWRDDPLSPNRLAMRVLWSDTM